MGDEGSDDQVKKNDHSSERENVKPEEPAKQGLDYSDDWMIDDVGAMESSDEEKEAKSEINLKEAAKDDNKPSSVESKKGLVYSDNWMIDDVGAIDSSDEEPVADQRPKVSEETKFLALKAPSYSDIASKRP